jgi:hypothetical protein
VESFTHPMFIFEFGVSFGGAFVILGMMLWDLPTDPRWGGAGARPPPAAAVPEVDAAVPPPGPPASPDHP